MTDWNWLWVIGELGISYVFYRWWKANSEFLEILKATPDIDIDNLKNFSSSTTSVHFATVSGLVQTNDGKPNSVIKSEFIPDCFGVIRRLTIRERKLEKIRTTWTETKNLISDVIRFVSFRLVSSKGNFIRVDKPLEFSSIQDQLEVIHVKFDPSNISSIEKLVSTFIGKQSTGIETSEQMLLVNAPLTGLGRLEKRAGIWYLIPHKQWGGILTRCSRNEILSNYQTRSNIARFISILFSITAASTAFYLIYQYYLKRQRQRQQINRLPTIPPPDRQNEENDQRNRIQCVICLENEIIYSLQPCSHLGLCQTCALELQTRNPRQAKCPICRATIREYQRVYLS